MIAMLAGAVCGALFILAFLNLSWTACAVWVIATFAAYVLLLEMKREP